jgi:hypothetical protein
LGQKEERKEGSGRWRKGKEKKRGGREEGLVVGFERERTEMTREERRKNKNKNKKIRKEKK